MSGAPASAIFFYDPCVRRYGLTSNNQISTLTRAGGGMFRGVIRATFPRD